MSRWAAVTLCVGLLFGLGACNDDPNVGRQGEQGEPKSEETTVPPIEPNDYYGEARRQVRDAGLRFEAIDVGSSGGLSGDKPYRIIEVTPAPGAVVETGSTVSVRMAFRTIAECPDIVACYPDEASSP